MYYHLLVFVSIFVSIFAFLYLSANGQDFSFYYFLLSMLPRMCLTIFNTIIFIPHLSY